MKDEQKTKKHLINELKDLRQRITELEESKTTERKKMEETIKESEEQYRVLVETIPDIIYRLDRDGRFVFISNAIKELGYDPKELIGKQFGEIIFSDDLKGVSRSSFRSKLKGEKRSNTQVPKYFDERRTGKRMTRNLEVRLAIKDQRDDLENIYYGEVSSSGYWDRNAQDKEKEFLGSIGIIRDITRRKKAEEELIESKKKLSEQNILLQEKNIALKEVMNHQITEKKNMEAQILDNIDQLLFPLLAKLKNKGSKIDRTYISLLEDSLKRLTSSFVSEISIKMLKLTPREIEICNMIMGGLTSKEIGSLLNISHRSVETHRNNIRNKLGITKKSINLATYLKSIQS